MGPGGTVRDEAPERTGDVISEQALLGDDPFPTVEHFSPLASV